MRRIVVLDTGPLLTWACIRLLQELEVMIGNRSSILAEISPGLEWTALEQERFSDFVSKADQRLTTSHVVTEALHLRPHSWLYGKSQAFVSRFYEVLHETEERCLLFKSIQASGFGELAKQNGITDAAVVCLAFTEARGRQDRVTLLTDDSRLFAALPSDPSFEICLTKHCI
ncbi:MAG: hypothetical protein ABIR70_11185 [Bryobacteraceae bacterium]